MASIRDSQIEAMASIDTAKAMVDKVLTIMGILTATPSLSLNFATNPIGFLLQLLKHVGVTYEDLRDWLAFFLTGVLPVLEISVKTVLLSVILLLSAMTACAQKDNGPKPNAYDDGRARPSSAGQLQVLNGNAEQGGANANARAQNTTRKTVPYFTQKKYPSFTRSFFPAP